MPEISVLPIPLEISCCICGNARIAAGSTRVCTRRPPMTQGFCATGTSAQQLAIQPLSHVNEYNPATIVRKVKELDRTTWECGTWSPVRGCLLRAELAWL